ncbi:hypothetical protein GVAV_001998 [Gurleya vavrai]
MKNIFLFLVVFYSLFFCSLSCIFKKNNDDSGNYEYKKKFTDPEFILQNLYLNDCKNRFSIEILQEIDDLRHFFVNQAVQQILTELGLEDKKRFFKRNFEICLDIIAKHKALKSFCPIFQEEYADYDVIGQYALKEHDECLKQKNEKYISQLIYEIPANLFDDSEFIADVI